MPKEKSAVPNRQTHTRISFLYQAANYFASLDTAPSSDTPNEAIKSYQEGFMFPEAHPTHGKSTDVASPSQKPSEIVSESAKADSATDEVQHQSPVSAHLASQILSISRKGQVKISQSMKRSICKRCNVILHEGKTSAVSLENRSRGGRKPWADILLVTCLACGMEKRYPLGNQKTSQRRKIPSKQAAQEPSMSVDEEKAANQ
jgi:ribonuclease P protein subunit RPR2